VRDAERFPFNWKLLVPHVTSKFTDQIFSFMHKKYFIEQIKRLNKY